MSPIEEPPLSPAVPDVLLLQRRPSAAHAAEVLAGEGLCHGGFDEGWDVMREQILQRQKEMGIVPPDTKLAANPDYIQAWDSLSDDAKTGLCPADGGLCDLGGERRSRGWSAPA